jgi:hypothetical protein
LDQAFVLEVRIGMLLFTPTDFDFDFSFELRYVLFSLAIIRKPSDIEADAHLVISEGIIWWV